MSTQRQIEANRLNALHSTGPRTPEGMARSAQNAFKSGLDADSQFVIGESREEFSELQEDYTLRFLPRTPDERFLVNTLIRNEWILRRLFRVEAHLWEYHSMRASRSDGVQLGEAFDNASPVFMRLQRRITLAERSYKEAAGELKRLQAARQPEPAANQPAEPAELADEPVLSTAQLQPPQAQSNELASFLNSLSSNPLPIPHPAPRPLPHLSEP